MVSVARAWQAAGSMPFPSSLSGVQDESTPSGSPSWTESLQIRLGRLLTRDASADDREAPADTRTDALTDALTTEAEDTTSSAQLEGIQLAAREIAHLVNNDLAVTVGTLDLLRTQDDLPPHARDLLERALAGVNAAALHVRRLQRVQRVITHDTPAGPALDLDRSV